MSRSARFDVSELIERWTLRDEELELVLAKHLDSRLAFALLLRFFGRYARLPRHRGELPADVVEFMARAVQADPGDLAGYDWSWQARTFKRHRKQVRDHFGYRFCGEEDGGKIVQELAAGAAQRLRRFVLVRQEFLAECRERKLELPSSDHIDRYVRSALYQAGKLLAARVAGRRSGPVIERLTALIEADDAGDGEPSLLRIIKSAPGRSAWPRCKARRTSWRRCVRSACRTACSLVLIRRW